MHWPSFILGLVSLPALVLFGLAVAQLVRVAVERHRRRRQRQRAPGPATLRFSTRLIGEIRETAEPRDERPAKAS